ncbi:hypothetical protein ACFQZ1_19465 [Bacillus sp. CGMCC 1.60114]
MIRSINHEWKQIKFLLKEISIYSALTGSKPNHLEIQGEATKVDWG